MKLTISAPIGVLFALALCGSAIAQPIQYQDADNINNIPVSAANPLPVTATFAGAVTTADGADVAQGAKADTSCATDTGTCTLIALNKRLNASITTLNTTATGSTPACVASPCVTVIGLTSNDPCTQGTKLGAPISLTASGQVITGTSAKKTYICSLDLVSTTAQNIALVEGTGTVCATNIYGLAGGTTAATGWNLAANGGLTKGSGAGTVYIGSADANGTAANVCLLLSSSGQTSGEMTYVQQ